MDSQKESNQKWIYDAFLSFRGEDTRNNFVSHLYKRLEERGFNVFKDDEKLESGRPISAELLKAIEESRIAIIVFSENYASSKWCLEELTKIMDCVEKKGQEAIPIFHNVDPSDLRRQSNSVAVALAKHEAVSRARWKDALCKADNIAGWDVGKAANRQSVIFVQNGNENVCMLESNRNEAESIDQIINEKFQNLHHTISANEKYLVGIESRTGGVELLLKVGLGGVRFVGIWGMGGMGKTTVARKIFDNISNQFQWSCFLANVQEDSKKHGMKHLQMTLLSRILNEKIYDYTKKVLIVFDDVDDDHQLEYLVGKHDWFGDGSRIIITTRNADLLRCHGELYSVPELAKREALELFSWYAFRRKTPDKEFFELSKSVVDYAKGLPLALMVLGSFLYKRGITDWRSALDRLKDTGYGEIVKQLSLSLDGLAYEDKNIFLDIACFFRGKRRDDVITILNSFGFKSEIGLDVLTKKSLIYISEGMVEMHDLIEQMGQQVARDVDQDKPWNHSRIWHEKDIETVFSTNQDCIFIMYDNQVTPARWQKYTSVPFVALKILLFLSSHMVHQMAWEMVFQSLPGLRMQEEVANIFRVFFTLWAPTARLKFPLLEVGISKTSFPSHNPSEARDLLRSLAKPDLSPRPRNHFQQTWTESVKGIMVPIGSDQHICKWSKAFRNMPCLRLLIVKEEEVRHYEPVSDIIEFLPSSLKWLDWSYYSFESLPANFQPRNLVGLNMTFSSLVEICKEPKRIVLKSCVSLVEVHPSIDNLKKLISLNMKNCRNLKFFLSSIQMESLESLNLSGCEKLEALPEIQGNMELLSELLLGCTAIRELPSSIGRLFGISLLDLRSCKYLVRLPDNVSKMRKLKVLILKGCLNLATFPESLGDLEELEELYAGNTAIRRLPDSMIKLNRLKILSLKKETEDKELKSLDLSGCILSGDKIFALICLTTLVELNLSRNKFVSLPDSISQLSRLRYLNITHCHELKKLPRNIEELYAEDFLAIQSILALWIYRRLYLVSFTNYSFNQQSYTEKSNDNLVLDKILSLFLSESIRHWMNYAIIFPESAIPTWFKHQSVEEKILLKLPQDWYDNRFEGFAICCVTCMGVGFHDPDSGLSGKYDHTFIKAKLICNNYPEELKLLEKECKVNTTCRSYGWCVCFAYIQFHSLLQLSDTEVRDFNQYGLFEASIQRKMTRQWGSKTEKELPAERLRQVNLTRRIAQPKSFLIKAEAKAFGELDHSMPENLLNFMPIATAQTPYLRNDHMAPALEARLK
ncbi:hypothetical protein H5410_033091 [Solanum commersonii]|uniref:ADP-ribosyl cyclase/cyclic ADP-ribose hydrolase n=1 Tax=Solanum commersonii TaxID=4109 RepID=A0A9J5YMT2_SOLCO|nr:hypothetical protein H5410_033091 [Solanum commersonii]